MADTRVSNRIIVGIIIVALGVMLLLDSTGVAETGSLARWIPWLFVLLGLWRLVVQHPSIEGF